jgi:serine phosphatase RsbU (regulator of sigma subunit)
VYDAGKGMADLHTLLLRQLRRIGASPNEPPDSIAWPEILASVSRAYRGFDEDRYTLERSLELSSQEMNVLYERIAAERDRLSRELEIPRVLQTALLPRETDVPFLDVGAKTVPASEAGGDYYEIVQLGEQCWLGIGDVTGHGLRAATIMMMVQSMVATLVRARPQALPSAQLAMVNQSLWDGVRNRLHVDDHVTCTLLRCNADGDVWHAGAHEDLIVSRAGAPCERIATQGTWLGVTSDVSDKNPDQQFRLERDDLLVLYTDGIIEAKSEAREEFGVDRLCALIDANRDSSVDEINARVFDEVKAWSPKQVDDLTLVVVRYIGK